MSESNVIEKIWNAKSGFELGVISERERICKLVTEQIEEWIDFKGDAYYAEALVDLIEGKIA